MQRIRLLLVFLALLAMGSIGHAQTMWELQAVDANGVATHPKVGAGIDPGNRITVEGIALNAPDELLPPGQMWQIFVQGEGEDKGGIAGFAAIFYDNSVWPRYPTDIAAGDRVRIEGYAAFHRGKANINERHSAAPELRMTVTRLASGVGLPAPAVIPSIEDCNYFDAQRIGGGERYQGRWVRLDRVWIAGGTWAAGETVTLTDASGQTLPMLLSVRGDFGSHPAPVGAFSVVGIFDQEDASEPFTGDYRLWVKRQADIVPMAPTAASDWRLYE